MNRELERAIRSATSLGALASALGISPRTLRRWRTQGVPTRGPGRARLRAERERQKALKAQERAERALFAAMMAEARQRGYLPGRARTRSWLRQGPRTVSMIHRLGVNRMLNRSTIEKIKQWARPIRGNRPLWQSQWRFTQYAIAPKRAPKSRAYTPFTARYQTVVALSVKQLSIPESADFGIGMQDASPQYRSKSEALGELLRQLTEAEESPMHITYVHEVTLFNTTKRTDEERRAWQSEQRRKRKRSWEARQRKKRKRS